jgi:transcriptional regulator of acetoin/glycerol metabolism
MRAASQVALLRLLQEREVTPVGATKTIRVDLRVVAATHRAVERLESGGFRGDLYARVAGYIHRLLPLRERLCDLGTLVAQLLKRTAAAERELRIEVDFVRALVAHDWPLNVRELEQALRVTSLLATDDGVLRLAHAPESLRAREEDETATSAEDQKLKEQVVAALQTHEGNVSRVAAELGKSRAQVHRWMKRFGLAPDSYRR